MEDVVDLRTRRLAAYRGRTALVTGHTGFKGAWLCLWLRRLGARVAGYALPPPTRPSLFELVGLPERMESRIGDVRDREALDACVDAVQPDVLFHLAAQPLVRESFRTPVETLEVNVVGTARVLEAARRLAKPCAVVVVTSDKCYRNLEWHHGYREADPLGGHDPYSMSKACAELVAASWRDAFCAKGGTLRIATARAGNVIGGGDWAADRIVVDLVKALVRNEPVPVRNPGARRPWQHVLEPLRGYLELGAELLEPRGERVAKAWNFGPEAAGVRTVRELVDRALRAWGSGSWRDAREANAPHEAGLLALSIDQARHELGWTPAWTFEQAVDHTIAWYKAWHAGEDPAGLCERELAAYTAAAGLRSS